MTLTRYIDAAVSVATGIHSAGREKSLKNGLPGSTLTDTSLSVAGGASALIFCWTTASGDPNIANWGSGTYRCVMNVTAAGADMSYGLRTAGTGNGHFARVDSGLTSDLETATQTEALFTSTGLKTATVTWDPSAGSTSDRFECLLAATNAGSMTQTVAVQSSTAGVSFADGPFDVGGTAAPPPFSRPWRTWRSRRAA